MVNLKKQLEANSLQSVYVEEQIHINKWEVSRIRNFPFLPLLFSFFHSITCSFNARGRSTWRPSIKSSRMALNGNIIVICCTDFAPSSFPSFLSGQKKEFFSHKRPRRPKRRRRGRHEQTKAPPRETAEISFLYQVSLFVLPFHSHTIGTGHVSISEPRVWRERKKYGNNNSERQFVNYVCWGRRRKKSNELETS